LFTTPKGLTALQFDIVVYVVIAAFLAVCRPNSNGTAPMWMMHFAFKLAVAIDSHNIRLPHCWWDRGSMVMAVLGNKAVSEKFF
jgi:hypothetical protein